MTIVNDDRETVAAGLRSAMFWFVGNKSVEGVYTCKAENRYGLENEAIHLRVDLTNNGMENICQKFN